MKAFKKEKIITWVKFHFWGLLVSLAICLVISLPPVIFHFSEHYKGVDMLKTNTEEHYVSQIQEVYDGHPSLGNPYLSDLKDTPYLFPIFGPNLMAAIGKILFLNAVQAVLVERFIFSFLTAFGLYLFTFAISKRRSISIVAPAVIMLAYNLLDPGVWIRLLHGYADFPRVQFIGYGRPVNPMVSFLIFVFYMLFFWRFTEEKKSHWYGVAAAVLLGISFYSYLFTWTFVFTLNAALMFVHGINHEWKKVKQIGFISLGGLVLGIPYLLHVLTIMKHPWYEETALRFGFVPSREINFSRVVWSALALFLVSWKLFTTEQRRFWTAFFIAAIFVVNHHLITGKFIFNHHYHWYYNTPLVLLFLVSLFFLVQEKFLKYRLIKSFSVIFLLVFCFVNAFLRQNMAYSVALPIVKEEQRFAPVFNWLNSQTEKDSTVLGNLGLMDVINSFTHNNAYDSWSSAVTLVPNIRLMDNFIVHTYLDNGPSTTIRDYFESVREEISYSVFDYQYRLTPGKCVACFPDEVITYMAQTYIELDNSNFLAFVKKYPVDYIVWDRKKDPQWSMDQYGLPALVEIGDFTIYKTNVDSNSYSR